MFRPMRVDVDDPARKGRTMSTYKLRSNIEQTTDLKKIPKECVLDSHVVVKKIVPRCKLCIAHENRPLHMGSHFIE